MHFDSDVSDVVFKEHLIYKQSAVRTVREQQEKGSCGWSRQPLKIEQQLSIIINLYKIDCSSIEFWEASCRKAGVFDSPLHFVAKSRLPDRR